MPTCPSCRRPVAVQRATCLYCGAALEAVLPEAVPAPGESVPPDGGRALVILDLAGVSAETLAHALSLPAYEAALTARRGGLHLHRALDPGAAGAEAARLAALGLDATVVPEAEARVRPRRAVGGERGEGHLALRTEEGPCVVGRGEILLVVGGVITREYQPSFKRRRVDTARLEEGYRVHLHLRGPAAATGEPGEGPPRPVELDAAHFEFGFAVTGSARLELEAWLETIAGNAPRDDGFRWLPPALGPASPPPRGALAAADSLAHSRSGADAPLVLDNVEQFRFYSGWRAAVERRRRR